MHAQHAAPKGNGGKTFLIAFAGALVACVLAFGVWGITSAMIPGSSGSGTSTVVTDPSTGETTVIAPSEDPTLAEAPCPRSACPLWPPSRCTPRLPRMTR